MWPRLNWFNIEKIRPHRLRVVVASAGVNFFFIFRHKTRGNIFENLAFWGGVLVVQKCGIIINHTMKFSLEKTRVKIHQKSQSLEEFNKVGSKTNSKNIKWSFIFSFIKIWTKEEFGDIWGTFLIFCTNIYPCLVNIVNGTWGWPLMLTCFSNLISPFFMYTCNRLLPTFYNQMQWKYHPTHSPHNSFSQRNLTISDKSNRLWWSGAFFEHSWR